MDGLFDLPPSEFVAARDALAKRLKAEGDTEGAAAVKALRRPSVAAWAVNQVARRQPRLAAAVIDAGRAVADALAASDRDGLRAATTARREAVSAAVREAAALAGDQHRDEIADAFEAAASDDAAAAMVRAGHVTTRLTPASVFAPLGDAPLPPKPAPKPKPRPDDSALRAARQRAEAADGAVADARHRLAEAEAAAKAAWAEVHRLTEP